MSGQLALVHRREFTLRPLLPFQEPARFGRGFST